MAAHREGGELNFADDLLNFMVKPQRQNPGRKFNKNSLFVLTVLRGRISIREIEDRLVRPLDPSVLESLLRASLKEQPFLRRRAQTVILHCCGISHAEMMRTLLLGRNTIKRYIRRFIAEGVHGLLRPASWAKGTKSENEQLRQQVLSILHAPPSAFGLNRTSWTISLLKQVLLSKGFLIGKNNVSKIVKRAGFKFWKAKEVLTSNDPEYRQKVDAIMTILANLQPNERFFSIDEYGPFAVKERGGRRLAAANACPTVPQFQRSKGSLIASAALELSTNQVTHFYSLAKNTQETIKW